MDINQIILYKEQRPTNNPKYYDNKRHKKRVNASKAISYKHISFKSKKWHCIIFVDQSQKQVSSVRRTHLKNKSQGFEVGRALYLKNPLVFYQSLNI